MNYDMGGYFPHDIDVVAAFDIDRRKVGERLDVALAAKPNCVWSIGPISKSKIRVEMGPTLDGVSEHMAAYKEDRTFLPSDKKLVMWKKSLRKAARRSSLTTFLSALRRPPNFMPRRA